MDQRRIVWKHGMLLGAAFIGLAFVGVGSTPPAFAIHGPCPPAVHWVGTWSSSMMPPQATFGSSILHFDNQTLRQIVHVSVGGNKLRVRLSNAYGSTPLALGAVHVALQKDAASIVSDSDRALTFSGQASVVIPAGEQVVSDSLAFDVPTSSNLAVSIFLPQASGPATWHETAQQTTYISPPGDFASADVMPVQSTATSYYWLSTVEVSAPGDAFAVVAFGDSITDGMGSTADANRRWPDFLSQRLQSRRHHHRHIGVLNQGISGNRLLREFVGPSGSDRFERDVLDPSGTRDVIVMIGINDIGVPEAFGLPDPAPSADEIITGLWRLVARAHARRLHVYGGTLTPCEGTFPGYFTPENEAKRQRVNRWIRASGVFDAVVDFDAVLRDPARPTQLLPVYDSGDHIHPNDAGYEAMANAIDLAWFTH